MALTPAIRGIVETCINVSNILDWSGYVDAANKAAAAIADAIEKAEHGKNRMLNKLHLSA